MRIFLVLFFYVVALLPVFSFTHMVPFFSLYSPQDYQGGKKNWSITQDKNGYIFVANNACVLRYDGIAWQKIWIKGGERAIRSLYADPDNDRIYVGLYEEFGYLQMLSTGEYSYISLSDSLTDFQMHNDEVWNICKVRGKIYFQTFASFFVYDGQTCKGYAEEHNYLYFMPDREDIYSYLIGEGVHRLDFSTHKFDKEDIPLSLGRIIQLKKQGDSQMIVTENQGLYLREGGLIKRIDSLGDAYPVANRALFTADGMSLLIGSIDQGILCFDLSGELKWCLNHQNGLPDNTVLNLYEDQGGNIWVALNNGIALLQPQSPLRIFCSKNNILGSVFGATLYNGRLFLATNHGVFCSKPDNYTSFSPFGNITSQVWMVRSFDKQLFIGANQLTYILRDDIRYATNPLGGGLALTRATINRKDVLLQGTYTHICLYEKSQEDFWNTGNAIDGFIQPVRFIEVDYQGNVWAAHIYKGLYRLRLNDSLTQVVSQVYYESLSPGINNRIALCKIDNRVVFLDGTQCYLFNDVEQKIMPYVHLNEQLGDFKRAKRIVATTNNRYWFLTDDEIALIEIVQENVKVIDIIDISSFKQLITEDEENIVFLGNGLHLLCLENGYMIYDEKSLKRHPEIARLQLTHVVGSGQGESVNAPLNQMAYFRYNQNRITFCYGFPAFGGSENYQVSYALNSDKIWVSQPKGESITLQNLVPNNYHLKIRIMNNQGEVVDVVHYDFKVTPPFYKSYLAIFFYCILGIFLFFYLRRYIIRHFEFRKKKEIAELLQKQKQEEIQKEQEIIRLQKEKLESELAFKSKELANYAIQELQQKEVLKKIRQEIVNAGLTRLSAGDKQAINKLTHTIDIYLEDNKSWKVFEQNFDLIHEKFFRKLHETYPALTPNDLRLCAYLRLNLTTKEIADLLHISIKGVEVARYRLRKKLSLPGEVTLLTFFLEQGD